MVDLSEKSKEELFREKKEAELRAAKMKEGEWKRRKDKESKCMIGGTFLKYFKYTNLQIREIERFETEVRKKVIFDAPDDWWAYSIEMRSSDISLFLEHFRVLFPVKDKPFMELENDEKYCLVTVKARFLTVEEYSKLHGIEHVTAVTRIRRGKLRSAVKFGKEWRIPALSPTITEGYTPATYKWNTYLSRLPIRYRNTKGNECFGKSDENNMNSEVVRTFGQGYRHNDCIGRTKPHYDYLVRNAVPLIKDAMRTHDKSCHRRGGNREKKEVL